MVYALPVMDMSDKNFCDDHFKEFLARKLGIERSKIPNPGIWFGTGETYAALSLKLDLLTTEKIDVILKEEQEQKLLFGEAAIKLGFIRSEQSEILLQLQLLHRNLALLEMMVLNNQIKLEDIWKILSEYEPRK
ncbi:MAG: hypothetical protein MRK01_03025 [Candidatus Scalindua sp.]|nr:hypothetical protein [Candidatus Scalindua sp.]